MNPDSGDLYRLRGELLDGAEVGDRIGLDELRRRVAELGEQASDDEVRAIRSSALVRVGEPAARKLMLGEREQERRRRRRKAAKRARRSNR